jgi:TP901 family phage tail tape measure protein
MTNRDLVIDIKSRFDEKGAKAAEAALKAQETAARRAQRELDRMERAAADQRAAVMETGQAFAVFGAAAVAGIGLAVKAAIDWESAWTGVTKTVEGTPQQMTALEESLRGLARELPATHKEIAAVAEAAGQLGIKRESILGFTRTMIALGETTNLSAEEAATALARLSNIMGTSQGDVGKFGASLVALGNAGASTESEIVEMALRIAGAGKTIGLSEGQVLGFASALSSVGINAEAGGSSISRVMITIAQAVDAGGQQLDKFAQVAGMSAGQFSAAFKDDAGGALAAFIEGLGQVESSGGSLFDTLQKLGFSEVEVRDALLRTAQAGSLLSDSLRTGEQAWADNSALVQEAARRYETTASKMQVAENNITDLGISIGQTFLPALGAAAEHTSGWIAMLGGLPEPVKAAGGVLVGLGGAAALVGGAAMIAVPKMVEFTKTLTEMGPRGAAVASRLSSLGGFLAGPWGLALGAAAVAALLFADSKAQAAAEVEAFTRAIEADSGALGDNSRAQVINRLQSEGLLDIARKLGIDLGVLTDAAMGNKNALKQVHEQLAASAGPADSYHTKVRALGDSTKVLSGDHLQLQQRLQAINGDLTTGADKWRQQQEALQGTSGAAQKTVVKVVDLESAMQGLTAEMSGQGTTAGDLAGFMQGLATAYGLVGDDAAAAAQKMIDSWSQAYTQFSSLTGVISSIESSGGSGRSGADQQAAAQERLAEVHRTSVEKIKRAQRELAEVRERSAEQIADANERIRDSEESLADTVEDVAQNQADAAERVADARRRVVDAAEDGARKIEAAERRVGDAVDEAADRQADAEQRLRDSHARTADAVEDLSAARLRAQERLEDLARSESTSAMDEEGAALAIERARERMAEVNSDPEASDLDRREADLAFRRAVQRLEEIKSRNAELRKELADANAAGVEGSAEVIQAQERIAAARRAEQEAELALAKQRQEGARAVAEAEQALADARRDAARQQQEAGRALADAEAEQNRARIDGAKEVLQAKRDVADAEKEAAKATRDAGRDVREAEEAVRQARRDAAQDAIKANAEVSKSWTDLGGTVAVTTDQFLAELEKQVRDQEKWADNLISLAGRVPDAMLKELAELGPGGARVVALASEMSDAELKKFVDLHGRSGKAAGDTFAQNLAAAGPVLREIARVRGQEVADKVREGMDGGRHSVFEAARRIGLDIDAGVGQDRTIRIFVKTEFQDDLSREALRIAVQNREMGGIDRYEAGGIQRFAMGGMRRPAGPMMATRPTVLFGEGRDDEAFIPYDRSFRGRAESLLSQVANDFGGVFMRPAGLLHAEGGGGGATTTVVQVHNSYSITTQVAPGADLAAVGAANVQAIQEYERRSGAAWRRGL